MITQIETHDNAHSSHQQQQQQQNNNRDTNLIKYLIV
jgi:hypothetical protein